MPNRSSPRPEGLGPLGQRFVQAGGLVGDHGRWMDGRRLVPLRRISSTNFDYTSEQTTKKDEGKPVPRDAYDDYEGFRRAGSAGAYARMHGLDQLPWDEKMIEHPAYDGFWQGQALDKLVAEHPSQVPTMWIQGLWDQEDMWGAIHCYMALKAKGQADHNYLVMGPWRHSQVNYDGYNLGPLKWDGDTALQFRRDVLRPFFDQYLKRTRRKPIRRPYSSTILARTTGIA